jgi:hypothetical protein
MTLAAILLVSFFCTVSVPRLVAATHLTARPSHPANNLVNAAATQDQGAASPAQTPSGTSQPPSAPAKTSSGQPPPRTSKRRRHKRRVIASNCTPAAATGDAATAGTSSTPTNCPPSKVIVRQGGTAEPSIQLAGGAAGPSRQKDTANQLLGTTEANLKKIAGHPLSSNQQDMVNQIRQFMEQSKAAVGDGDLERARTLAWKAQLLSEELVKPSK